MVPVATTTSVKSSGLGKSRQMPVIGRRGWGLEDPALLVTMFTFLFHFSSFLPYLRLFSPPLLPVLARCCSAGQPEAHGGCSCSEPVSQYLPGFSRGGGWGVQFSGMGADG